MRFVKMTSQEGRVNRTWLNLPAAESSWCEGPLVAFDCETTSASPMTGRIVTAAIVIDVPEHEQHTYKWLANPECEIEIGAIAVHGIDNQTAIEKGQDMASVIREILDVLDSVLVLHGPIPIVVVNSQFDLTLLHNEIRRLGIDDGLDLRLPVIDTLVCDRALDTYRTGRRTLTATMAAHGMAMRNAHQASGDCVAAIRLARAQGRKYPEFGSADLECLQVWQRESCLKRATEFQAYRRSDGLEPDFTVATEWPFTGWTQQC